MIRLDIEKLLSFLDNPKPEDAHNASSIVGVIGEDLAAGAYMHYYRNTRRVLHDVSVTEGKKRGKWLDRWFVDDTSKTLYQCEIKSWSASAIGGHRLALDASPEEVKRIGVLNMRGLAKNFVSEVQPNHVTKVLQKMRLPDGTEYSSYTVLPLLIVWMCVADDTSEISPILQLQNVPCGLHFNTLEVFSVSLYLRSLYAKGIREIDIDAPSMQNRINTLNSFIASDASKAFMDALTASDDTHYKRLRREGSQ